MNIVLIGMPGCGKTTVGRALAALLDREFVCSDEMVEAESGMRIPEIFARFGEAHFRALECDAVSTLVKKSDVIIATGGGAVLAPQNREALRAEGNVVVWLEREVDALEREGRPLSQSADALREMYAARRPIYEEMADVKVKVEGSVGGVVREIVRGLGERNYVM